MGEVLKKQGAKFEYGTARLEDRAAILADIERVRDEDTRPARGRALGRLGPGAPWPGGGVALTACRQAARRSSPRTCSTLLA